MVTKLNQHRAAIARTTSATWSRACALHYLDKGDQLVLIDRHCLESQRGTSLVRTSKALAVSALRAVRTWSDSWSTSTRGPLTSPMILARLCARICARLCLCLGTFGGNAMLALPAPIDPNS